MQPFPASAPSQAPPQAAQGPQVAQTPRAPTTPEPYLVRPPRTGDEVSALRIRLDDLRRELQDAASRRRTVSEQLRSTDSKARPGLEERLGVLDARIVQIEKDISASQLALANAEPIALVEARRETPDPNLIVQRVTDDLVPIVAILTVFVFAPFTLAISRFFWKRATSGRARPALADTATQQRLEQLQQSVDTIAIEVERISEGQRFVTKLMNERANSAIGAGASAERR